MNKNRAQIWNTTTQQGHIKRNTCVCCLTAPASWRSAADVYIDVYYMILCYIVLYCILWYRIIVEYIILYRNEAGVPAERESEHAGVRLANLVKPIYIYIYIYIYICTGIRLAKEARRDDMTWCIIPCLEGLDTYYVMYIIAIIYVLCYVDSYYSYCCYHYYCY